jgi:hypothetical protein
MKITTKIKIQRPFKKSRKSSYRHFWILVLVISPFLLQAQLNLKIGYDGAFAAAPAVNNSIAAYNQSATNVLNEAIPKFHWLHGLNMGVRYKKRFLSTEIAWESLGNRITAVEVDGTNASEKTIYFRLNHLAFNQELSFGFAGIGASAEWGFYTIETDLSGTSQKKTLSAHQPFSSKIFLSFNFKGSDLLSFSVKPYYRLMWTRGLNTQNLNALWQNGLQGEEMSLDHFGIHLCFYNGPQ